MWGSNERGQLGLPSAAEGMAQATVSQAASCGQCHEPRGYTASHPAAGDRWVNPEQLQPVVCLTCSSPFACPSLQQLTLATPDERRPLLQRTASERRKARRNVNQRFLTAMMEMGIPSEKVGH